MLSDTKTFLTDEAPSASLTLLQSDFSVIAAETWTLNGQRKHSSGYMIRFSCSQQAGWEKTLTKRQWQCPIWPVHYGGERGGKGREPSESSNLKLSLCKEAANEWTFTAAWRAQRARRAWSKSFIIWGGQLENLWASDSFYSGALSRHASM